jgi:hypothetical protein
MKASTSPAKTVKPSPLVIALLGRAGVIEPRFVPFAEHGKIAVVEEGRDCDGVQYSGHVRIIDATLAAFNELEDRLNKWADGPFHLSLMLPSEAAKVEAQSRDRTLEAFEDGHPWSI